MAETYPTYCQSDSFDDSPRLTESVHAPPRVLQTIIFNCDESQLRPRHMPHASLPTDLRCRENWGNEECCSVVSPPFDVRRTTKPVQTQSRTGTSKGRRTPSAAQNDRIFRSYSIADKKPTPKKRKSQRRQKRSSEVDRSALDLDKLLATAEHHCRHCTELRWMIVRAGLGHLITPHHR